MPDKENISEFELDGQKIIENVELNIWEALIPVFILVGLLAYNIFYADGEMMGEYSNQFILLIGGGVGA
ncbi:MAG: sodium:proton antiporter, partial [Bacteroidia bacterium]|nr:sodium:proton antiporter [Bacteroidia bacterium]